MVRGNIEGLIIKPPYFEGVLMIDGPLCMYPGFDPFLSRSRTGAGACTYMAYRVSYDKGTLVLHMMHMLAHAVSDPPEQGPIWGAKRGMLRGFIEVCAL